jgi:hypothetical protein
MCNGSLTSLVMAILLTLGMPSCRSRYDPLDAPALATAQKIEGGNVHSVRPNAVAPTWMGAVVEARGAFGRALHVVAPLAATPSRQYGPPLP